MAPGALLLAMHQHEHTEDTVTADVVVGKAHIHCDVDELYTSSFTAPSFSFELALGTHQSSYAIPGGFAWKFTYPNNTYLRGPPVA